MRLDAEDPRPPAADMVSVDVIALPGGNIEILAPDSRIYGVFAGSSVVIIRRSPDRIGSAGGHQVQLDHQIAA